MSLIGHIPQNPVNTPPIYKPPPPEYTPPSKYETQLTSRIKSPRPLVYTSPPEYKPTWINFGNININVIRT